MSGLYITKGNLDEAQRAAQLLAFTRETRQTVENIGDSAIAIARVDSPELWNPAQDLRTKTFVALGGRLAFDAEDWSRAEKLPFDGGLACRLILDAWLNDRKNFPQRLNGAGCVVIVDPRENELHVWTDRLGVFPLYQTSQGGFRICSHPDVLADIAAASGEKIETDFVTLAEFLGTASSVHPHTYYKQIRQLDPATHHVWNLKTLQSRKEVVWRPAYLDSSPSSDAETLAEELAEAFRGAVRRRTNARLGKSAVLLSGGADSRAALFGAENPAAVKCFTLFDEPNAELATAKRLADTAGAVHVSLQRDPDYYANNAAEAARISGGMWSLVDAHYLGFADEIRSHQPETILSGCYADYMFKGLLFNRTPRKLFGHDLPLYNFAPFDFSFYQNHAPLRQNWTKQVLQRLETRFPRDMRSRYSDNLLTVEDLRLRPLSREPDASGRLVLWRTLPWDHLLSDTNILDVYGRIAPELKLNGILFGEAVAKVIGREGRIIPNSNHGAPVDASETQRAVKFLLASLKRKVRRAFSDGSQRNGIATTGSWPNWNHYVANSPKLAELWASPTKTERELFTDILGRDPWNVSLPEWGSNEPLLFMRVLTAKIWLRQRRVLT